jgi:hypothetical protein
MGFWRSNNPQPLSLWARWWNHMYRTSGWKKNMAHKKETQIVPGQRAKFDFFFFCYFPLVMSCLVPASHPIFGEDPRFCSQVSLPSSIFSPPQVSGFGPESILVRGPRFFRLKWNKPLGNEKRYKRSHTEVAALNHSCIGSSTLWQPTNLYDMQWVLWEANAKIVNRFTEKTCMFLLWSKLRACYIKL